MKYINLLAILFMIAWYNSLLLAQGQGAVIDITEQTIKLLPLQNKKIYFAAATGDELLITLDVLENNVLKKIELLAYPETPIYTDYSVNNIQQKSLKVNKEGVYVLHLKNSYFKPSITKIKIQRRPEFESTIYFNTQVRWESKEEIINKSKTEKQIVGYDTIYNHTANKSANKIVYKEEMISNKKERVDSRMRAGSPTRDIYIELPKDEISENRIKKIKSWSYWIGVGEEASIAWQKNVDMFASMTKGAITIMGGGPLTAMAAGAIPNLILPNIGEDVKYYVELVDTTDYVKNDFDDYKVVKITEGKGIVTFGKHDKDLKGEIYIYLHNDNYMQDINVDVKIAVLWEELTYDLKESKDMKIVPKYAIKATSKPKIKKIKVPVY